MITESVLPASEERAALIRLVDLLGKGEGRLLGLIRSGVKEELPRSICEVLTRVAETLAAGRGVAVMPVDRS